jgi:hypothetical protein
MHVSLSDVTGSGIRLTAEEAVAIALAAAHQCDQASVAEFAVGLPASSEVLLDGRGRLWFSATGPQLTDSERVKQMASLLQTLLCLAGGPEPPGSRSPVPGALVMLIARAGGQIDLPTPSFVAFRDALRRFGSPEPATLAAVYRRTVAHRPGTERRELRAADLQRFAARRQATRPRWGRIARAGAVAASLAVAAVALSSRLSFQDHDDDRVQIVHERPSVVETRSGVASPPASPPRRVGRPGVTAALLLSPADVGADVFSPSFTEYGRELLFHRGRNRSALMRASFDNRGRPAFVTVLQDGAANFHVTQSPDGKWIAYDSDRDGTRGVYVAPSDDILAARKVSGTGYAAIPKWSFDGRKLAFVRAEARRPRVWNVWVADLDAHTLSRVSRHSVGQAWGASWFPDGGRLAYSVEDRLVIADRRNGTTRTVQSPRPRHLIRTPAVSPNGQWVVFQVHRDGVWLFEIASGKMRRVLDDATAEEFAWSPDSTRVIYHARRNGAWALWQFALNAAA